MPRMTAEILKSSGWRGTNPCSERELSLRGLGFAAIENLAVAGDDYDCLDLCNNRIARLENFPRLPRLSTLLCADNMMESFDAANLSKNVPNLTSLTLSHNNISSLTEVLNIGKAFPKLEFLSLDGNPVTRLANYRLHIISSCTALKVLDFQKIKPAERSKAKRLAMSTPGESQTFVPGEGPTTEEQQRSFVSASYTPELIRSLLANASSAKEVAEIENALKQGTLPASLVKKHAVVDTVPADEKEEEPETKRRKVQ